jgi:thiamine-monophosphate kinase
MVIQMPINLSPLGTGSEFDKIRAIWRALGDRAAGGGDDCAIVRVGTEQLAISTDLALEGVHFQAEWLEPAEIGWRAAAAALSDLAAVAAEPAGVLVSLGVPAERPDEFVAALMRGVGEVAGSVGAVVWGGDLVRSEQVVIDVAVVGRVATPVLRAGAGVGDQLWVTGRLGGAHAAVSAWRAGGEPEVTVRARFARPQPRTREALWLARRGAKAMIDLSDGLVADAGQIAAASGVRCVIEAGRVPVHPGTAPDMAPVSGEEFELLLALPAAVDLGQEFEQTFGMPLTAIGRAESGAGVSLWCDGREVDLPVGFRHF